jgi:GT2 family glycosyltransferase
MKKVSVIIINYNSSNYTLNCIESLKKFHEDYFLLEIIVVDNNSENNDYIKLVNGLKKHSIFKLKRSIINSGFSGGNMLGAQYANGDYFLFLNNDVVLNNKALSIAYDFMESQANVGVCTAQNFDENNNFIPSYDHHKGLRKLIFGRSFLESLNSKKYPNRKQPHIKPIEVDFVNGAFMFFKKEAFEKVGGFDTNLFLYFEEMDICFNLQKNGWKCALLPEAKIIHFLGASTEQNKFIKQEGLISYLYVIKKNYSYLKFKTILSYLFITFLFKPKKWKLFPVILKGGSLSSSIKQKQIIRF